MDNGTISIGLWFFHGWVRDKLPVPNFRLGGRVGAASRSRLRAAKLGGGWAGGRAVVWAGFTYKTTIFYIFYL
jgi:hypothetical protein